MKILAFSDLHGDKDAAAMLVKASAEADLVIAAGDFCNYHNGLAEAVALLREIPCPILAVPGNHETVDELTAVAPPQMTVLHGQTRAVGNLSFFGIGYGIPVTPFGDWSKDLPRPRQQTCSKTATKSISSSATRPPKASQTSPHRGKASAPLPCVQPPSA